MADKTPNKQLPAWTKRDALHKPDVVAQLKVMADAAYASARKTDEAGAKAGFMDRCHTLREAVRYLSNS